MKTTVIVFLALCFSTTMVNAQRCGCFTDENAPVNYLHASGKTTATINFNVINLANGIEISPEAEREVWFKFVNTPNLKPTCKNVYLISVYDQTDRRYVHEQSSETAPQFSYAFPRSDRAYRVTLKVTAVSRTDIDPGLIRDQVCYRETVINVRPKPRQCDCVAENGINSILVAGSVSVRKSLIQGQNAYVLNTNVYNKSKCSLAVESITLMDAVLNPALAIGLRGEAPFQAQFETDKPIVPKVEGKFRSVSIGVKYSLNGKTCRQDFVMQFSDKK
ncbi:hypothetical protein GVN16_13845 [Emticicia sp. CRIBPO]|uniref:hypothetical protein n=1 Tax=Emticicia sp. CRIBPO TaxID=2683258 RepID=UPI001411FA0F|nr:hypothetical protein [Emticicia sp. CRIBPO]NBA86852.1 hypothetical protein [Emticicia sp. CRIBPO]